MPYLKKECAKASVADILLYGFNSNNRLNKLKSRLSEANVGQRVFNC